MVSPYLERRLRSYREALREIRKRHAARRAVRAKEKLAAQAAQKGRHLRLIAAKRPDRPPRGTDV